MPCRSTIALAFVMVIFATTAAADDAVFTPGPLLEDFGPVAKVESEMAIPDGAVLKVSFDTRDKAEPGALNKTLVSAARFLNMHAGAGVAPENMKLAVVLHGAAVRDVTHNSAYKSWNDADNANVALISALTANGVEIYVCGQSAAYYDVKNDNLAPGVTMALSAMTAHALLQAEGYTLNPF